LAELRSLLNQAVRAQGQVGFVVGEAGSGKTALVAEFASRAQKARSDLVVTIGNCNAQTGIGDPYLPFREILAQLTGDFEAKLAQGAITAENARRLRGLVRWSCNALLEFGPDLINTVVPGTALIAKAGKFVLDQAGWLDKFEKLVKSKPAGPAASALGQSHIFEQYTNVLKALSHKSPLMLVLDDLQWADSASISLLFHLGRRIRESRILVLGAYRPEEVKLGRGGERHPLDKVLAEFKRYFGDIWVDLDQAERDEARQFVDALLDLEPNRLGEDFRRALVHHTGGHPLFAVELLRDMQERGDLERDALGCWVEGTELDWDDLPPRVEGVIEERIGRLEAELRETLTVGSVEGEQFTAEVIARVRAVDERGLVSSLSNALDRRHHLVVSQGIQRLGDQRLSSYRFRHNLFQTYLYDGLDAAQKAYLHEDVGLVLEALYGDQVEEIAPQLARHFQEAGMAEKAVEYLLQAGDQARMVYAHEEAIGYYERALALLREQGDHQRAARTLLKMGLVYSAAFQPDKAREAYEEAFGLWDPGRPTEGLAGLQEQVGVLRLAVDEPLTLDPGKAGDDTSTFMTGQLFEGLVEVDEDYNVLPAVAARWEMDQDGTRYLFHLREGVRWSDGTRLTASDFERTWKRNLDPATGSPVAHLLYAIENGRAFGEGTIDDSGKVGVTALDDRTLEVRLEAPTAYLLHLLAHPVAYPLPPSVVQALVQPQVDYGNLISNGPYQLVAWQRGQRISLARNPFYRGQFRGNATQVECPIFTDFGPVLDAYAADALDAVSMITSDAGTIARARAAYGDELVLTPQLSTVYLVLRVDQPPFDDVRVRRALAHAVDREGLARDAWQGQCLAATGGFVPPGMPGHSSGIGLAYDPSLARRLLREAGYPGGEGFPEITWLYCGGPGREPVVPFLRNAWREHLHLGLSGQNLEWDAFLDRVCRDPPDLALWGWFADYPDPDSMLRVTFHSREGFINTGWHSARFDALVEEAARIADRKRRMALYREADRILVAEEAVVVPLGYGRGRILVKPWVTVPRLPSALLRLKDVVCSADRRDRRHTER
jgi:ABC-type oligopeptide transport system substrate-binding subunit/tetratricopeptide (TPR) repeat protein